MALEGTHIRFALGLKEYLDISEIDKYVSGTVYPDSRHPTGTPRELTHSNALVSDFLSGDDSFKKGWAVHLICDTVQSKLFHEWFPEIFEKEKDVLPNNIWFAISAIKTIQDNEDMKYFDIQKYLPCLDYADNPNGENINIIKKYNNNVQAIYNQRFLSIEQGILAWKTLGVDEKNVQKIQYYIEKYLDSENSMSKIRNLYGEVLKRGLAYVNESNSAKIPAL